MKNDVQRDPIIEQIRETSRQNGRSIHEKEYRRPYGSRNISQDDSERSTFFLRVGICILLFGGFCFMKQEDRVIGTYDSSALEALITSKMDMGWIDKLGL